MLKLQYFVVFCSFPLIFTSQSSSSIIFFFQIFYAEKTTFQNTREQSMVSSQLLSLTIFKYLKSQHHIMGMSFCMHGKI